MPPELIGYANRFSVRPGEDIRFMVSTDLPDYDAAIVRLIHGDENPAGPGLKEQLVQTAVNRQYTRRNQIPARGPFVGLPVKPSLSDHVRTPREPLPLPPLPATRP